MTDVAIMPLSVSVRKHHLLQHHFCEPMAFADPRSGASVTKIGAITGTTSGRVLPESNFTRNEGQVFLVMNMHQGKPFAVKGDSGALVFREEDGKRVALGIVHSQVEQNDHFVYICIKITHCLEALRNITRKNFEIFDDQLTPELILSHRFDPCMDDIHQEDRRRAQEEYQYHQ